LEWDLQDGPEGVERPNMCRVKYFSPEARYTVEEIPDVTELPWAKVESEIDRVGEREQVIELPFCTDHSQAQRIARRLFHMGRAPILVIKTSLAGMALDRVYCANIEIDGLGENEGVETLKCILDDLVVNNGDGTCEAVWRVIPDVLKTAFNPATDEKPAPPLVPLAQYSAELPTPDAPTLGQAARYGDGGPIEVRVSFTTVSGATINEVVYQVIDGSGNPIGGLQSMDERADAGSPVSLRFAIKEATDLVGLRVQFRYRAFDEDEDGSDFSEIHDVASLAFDTSAPSSLVTDDAAATLGTFTPGAPEPVSFSGTFRTVSINASYLRLERSIVSSGFPDVWTEIDEQPLRPDEEITFEDNSSKNAGETAKYRVTIYNSTGVAGTQLAYTAV